jgi:predicted DNA-binding transcriptional regulator AlpA
MDDLLTPEEVVDRLKVGRATLSAWRVRGEGPPWLRLENRLIRYPASGLTTWLAEQTAKATS